MILMLRTTIVILVISSVHYFEKIWILVNFIWEDGFGHFYWSYFQQTILNIRSGKLSDLCSFETAHQIPASLVAEVWWKELFSQKKRDSVVLNGDRQWCVSSCLVNRSKVVLCGLLACFAKKSGDLKCRGLDLEKSCDLKCRDGGWQRAGFLRCKSIGLDAT